MAAGSGALSHIMTDFFYPITTAGVSEITLKAHRSLGEVKSASAFRADARLVLFRAKSLDGELNDIFSGDYLRSSGFHIQRQRRRTECFTCLRQST